VTATPLPTDEVTHEERRIAMLAHLLGIVTLPLGPLLVCMRHSKSGFVRFHSLQAMFFQLALMAVWLVAGVLAFSFIGLIFVPFVMVAQVGYPLLAAIKTRRGEWFKYRFVGDWTLEFAEL
jgi:uncharacterized protein